jgi:Trk-type K+ transport system membrane component
MFDKLYYLINTSVKFTWLLLIILTIICATILLILHFMGEISALFYSILLYITSFIFLIMYSIEFI